MQVKVELKNPPSGADKWQMSVVDWDITAIQSWGTTARDNIGEIAIFDIPAEWSFPLRINIRIYETLYDTHGRQLYGVQSYRPYLWDWDLDDWGTEPDPTYKAIFIPGPGSYYYNAATEKFELIEAAIAGTITKKELDYQNIWQTFPLLNIPLNTRTRVRITGRNDTPVTQRMGIYWFVADPDGLVVQEYSVWEAWPYTGAGGEHQFIGSSFDLSKVGKYTTWVELLMNPDSPEVVDMYIGDLCTVTTVLVPTFSELAIASFSKA